MGLYVANLRTFTSTNSVESRELIEHVGLQRVCFDIDGATTEAHEVVIGNMCTYDYVSFHRQTNRVANSEGISSMKPASDVCAGNNREHGCIIAHPPVAIGLAQVGVEIDPRRDRVRIRDKS